MLWIYIYIVENEDCEPLFLGSHGVFIAHDSCLFVEKKDWRVTSSSWYFELHCELYFTHFIQLKDYEP